jgi:hypothetical protein
MARAVVQMMGATGPSLAVAATGVPVALNDHYVEGPGLAGLANRERSRATSRSLRPLSTALGALESGSQPPRLQLGPLAAIGALVTGAAGIQLARPGLKSANR